MNVELIWNKGNISPTFGSQLLSCSILVQLFTNWLKNFNLWLKRKSCCPRAAFVSSESEPPTGAVANMMGHYSSSIPLFEIFTQIPPFRTTTVALNRSTWSMQLSLRATHGNKKCWRATTSLDMLSLFCLDIIQKLSSIFNRKYYGTKEQTWYPITWKRLLSLRIHIRAHPYPASKLSTSAQLPICPTSLSWDWLQ